MEVVIIKPTNVWGGILRNHEGKMILTYSIKLSIRTPLQAEVMACWFVV